MSLRKRVEHIHLTLPTDCCELLEQVARQKSFEERRTLNLQDIVRWIVQEWIDEQIPGSQEQNKDNNK